MKSLEGFIGKVAYWYFRYQLKFKLDKENPYKMKLANYYVLGKELFYDQDRKTLSPKKGDFAVDLHDFTPEDFQEFLSRDFQELIDNLHSTQDKYLDSINLQDEHFNDLNGDKFFNLASKSFDNDIVNSNWMVNQIKKKVSDLSEKTDLSEKERIPYIFAQMLRGESVKAEDRTKVIDFLRNKDNSQSAVEVNRFILTTERLFNLLDSKQQRIEDRELIDALETYRNHAKKHVNEALKKTQLNSPKENFDQEIIQKKYIINKNLIYYLRVVENIVDSQTKEWVKKVQPQKFTVKEPIKLVREKFLDRLKENLDSSHKKGTLAKSTKGLMSGRLKNLAPRTMENQNAKHHR